MNTEARVFWNFQTNQWIKDRQMELVSIENEMFCIYTYREIMRLSIAS